MEISKTPYGSKRIFIRHNEMPENITQMNMVFMVLGTLSIWGNYDVNNEIHKSWEFDEDIPNDVLERTCKRLGL